MSKRSGEQQHRLRGLAASERYAQVMDTRDKLRLVKTLRDAAARLEAQTKAETAHLQAARDLPSPLAVTDHAVVRFMERVMGCDMNAIRSQIARAILARDIPAADEGRGAHSICARDGFQFLITRTSVISVLTAEMDGQGWLEKDELEALCGA